MLNTIHHVHVIIPVFIIQKLKYFWPPELLNCVYQQIMCAQQDWLGRIGNYMYIVLSNDNGTLSQWHSYETLFVTKIKVQFQFSRKPVINDLCLCLMFLTQRQWQMKIQNSVSLNVSCFNHVMAGYQPCPSLPDIENGIKFYVTGTSTNEMADTGISCDVVTDGNSCHYACVEGYRLTSHPAMICNRSGDWIGDIPSCESRDTIPFINVSYDHVRRGYCM